MHKFNIKTMDNSYFLLTNKSTPISIERFQVCSWEFKNKSALIEFGCEVNASDCNNLNEITIELYVPWLSQNCNVVDLYENLKDSANSKFIFNESVRSVIPLDDGQNSNGVIHEFIGRSLCIIPVTINKILSKKLLAVKIDLNYYHKRANNNNNTKPNIYFRFYLEPSVSEISTRKTGISKSTIIYDIKINEKRNLPDYLFQDLKTKDFCKILTCFYLNVVPNSFELTFLDNTTLKSVRTLEYESFNRYLKDKRVEKNELLVIFNKKEARPNDNQPSYSFFSIFHKERIGAGQFALAIMINLVCGILLFIPAFREQNNLTLTKSILSKLPIELYLAFGIGLVLIIYFIWPSICLILKSSYLRINKRGEI